MDSVRHAGKEFLHSECGHMQMVLEARRARVAAHWGVVDEIVLVHAGGLISRPGGQDQCFPLKSTRTSAG